LARVSAVRIRLGGQLPIDVLRVRVPDPRGEADALAAVRAVGDGRPGRDDGRHPVRLRGQLGDVRRQLEGAPREAVQGVDEAGVERELLPAPRRQERNRGLILTWGE
jgi:hypothetical protein